MHPPIYEPLETVADLAAALDLPPLSVDTEILIFLQGEALPSDRSRLRMGFPLVVRAWEIWRARGPQICARDLRGQLAAEGFPISVIRG